MLKDLLYAIKGFRYQITVKVLLNKHKENGDIEFAPVYFHSTTKTLNNSEYMPDKYFQEVVYITNNWINEWSDLMIESIETEYGNISIFGPLLGSSYIEVPHKLKNAMKGLINVKDKDNKYILWCHIRYLNPFKRPPEE